MDIFIVYVKPNDIGYITDVDSSAFLSDTTGWVEIDRGIGIKYRYAHGDYFPRPIETIGGAYRYKLVDGVPTECTAEEIAAQEEANKHIPVEPERSMWEELDEAYQSGIDSI